MNIIINKNQLSDIYNIYYGAFKPLKTFISKKEFFSIANNMYVKKNIFFPFPIYFSLNKISRNTKFLNIFFKRKKICQLIVRDIYTFTEEEKNQLGKKIFGTTDPYHPGFNYFYFKNKYFIDCTIKDFNENLNVIKFSKPSELKNILINRKIVNLAGFHTRNVPHRAHEWIHQYGLKKCKNLLIQPLIGQYRAGEFKESKIIETNKKIVNDIYKNSNTFFSILNSYPRYAGPKEAIFHAMIRKNYGCTHFLIGRDHAGVSNFYDMYESQNFAKKYEKKIGIKILKFNEPYMCEGCKNIMNSNCRKCVNKNKIKISGTSIREKISKNKNISKFLMRPEISKLLSTKSIIK